MFTTSSRVLLVVFIMTRIFTSCTAVKLRQAINTDRSALLSTNADITTATDSTSIMKIVRNISSTTFLSTSSYVLSKYHLQLIIEIVVLVALLFIAACIAAYFFIPKWRKIRRKSKTQQHVSIRFIASSYYETIGPPLPERPAKINSSEFDPQDGNLNRHPSTKRVGQQIESGYAEVNLLQAPLLKEVAGYQRLDRHLEPLDEDEHGYLRYIAKQRVLEITKKRRFSADAKFDNWLTFPEVDEKGYLKLDNFKESPLEDERGYLRTFSNADNSKSHKQVGLLRGRKPYYNKTHIEELPPVGSSGLATGSGWNRKSQSVEKAFHNSKTL